MYGGIVTPPVAAMATLGTELIEGTEALAGHGAMEPARYDAWYRSPRGRWIGEMEFRLLSRLLRAHHGASLLDVGAGTGYFSRRFAAAGLHATVLDPDRAMLAYARRTDATLSSVAGTAAQLPFVATCYDYSIAVTSLCFVSDPAQAVAQMWRVARRGVLLGLLNRHSLLYRQKQGHGAYAGARWDSVAQVRRWADALSPAPRTVRVRSAVFIPSGSVWARLVEHAVPHRLTLGGFLAVYLEKTT